MNSLDTNILLYAVNVNCEEHEKAQVVYEAMLSQPDDWILCDQVLIEFYRLLRNGKVLEKPLSHRAALTQICFLREDSGVRHCSYHAELWDSFLSGFEQGNPASTRIFDHVIGTALLGHGVKTFYTRNLRDFRGMDFEKVINPID